MKRHERKFFVALGVSIVLIILGYFTRANWWGQFSQFYLEKMTVRMAAHYKNLPVTIDAVEVFRLSDQPDAKDTNGFYGDFEEPIGTLEHKALTGSDAKEIVDLWGKFQTGQEFQAMCFDPAYGLQFRRNGKIYFQTSVCWDCSGYTLPVPFMGTVQYGFDSNSKDAQKLLAILEQHIPLPPKPVKVLPRKQGAAITN